MRQTVLAITLAALALLVTAGAAFADGWPS